MATKAEIIAKAWKDPTFKKKLLSSPKEALRECGVSVPAHIHVKVVEESENHYTFVLPVAPANSQHLSDAALSKVAAGQKLDAQELAIFDEMQ